LTHVALAVRDPQRSLRFYEAVLGMVPVYDQGDFVQAQTPGTRDVLVFERNARKAGKAGGVVHFGFRLQSNTPVHERATETRKHGTTTGRGEQPGWAHQSGVSTCRRFEALRHARS
jgi:catechol 2,3-dioxygenase-like lactoylglutathione lyase family enzyme